MFLRVGIKKKKKKYSITHNLRIPRQFANIINSQIIAPENPNLDISLKLRNIEPKAKILMFCHESVGHRVK